ncbi:tRNA (adenosine(37)-N6)-threonylcarbamoyltransferase complex dimerization subunit type 1 TsaB [Aquimarina agarilytica]|uniref:tRNA (adenosine(37)-N6)-threonylcarbamoyltransferase complex dimerization subunit type 1 TsaB n=1 Tax=Aquimarina agarilytica TaxID=1087449 RepID=UPI000288805F|nr:tRNA (adenosine(37)-N6)-threonylcarbamoyltransferase complex dimerization subunit type 1 TsaB [Aquimarina agarilytica]
MSYLLCIETSTTNCSVALSLKGNIVSFKEDNSKNYSHAESLHVFIEALLAEAKVSLQQIDAIVVSKGPGSYTGLRIGVSAAKGLCYALDIPLISINTLESLAHQTTHSTTPSFIVPMLDARRMEVYTATYNNHYDCLDTTHAKILDETSYMVLLDKQKTIFIGNGVTKFKEICTHNNAVIIEDALPSAKQLGKLGYQKFQNNDFDDVAYFEPYYLKDFVAGKPKQKKQ